MFCQLFEHKEETRMCSKYDVNLPNSIATESTTKEHWRSGDSKGKGYNQFLFLQPE
jgi:hypothetical protein